MKLHGGDDFLSITGGVSSILAPLAQVGVSVFQTKQMEKLTKAQAKAEMQQAQSQPMIYMPSAPAAKPKTGLLIGIVLGGVILLGVVATLSGSADFEEESGSSEVERVSQAPKRIKRIRRVSRTKKPR